MPNTPLSILLVDDAMEDRMAVRRAIAKSTLNASVEEIGDIRTALRRMRETNFSVAIVDFNLPDGDALDLLRRGKAQDSELPPVVVLTGQGSETVAADSIKAGALDYLPKSELTPSRIAQSLRNAVRVHHAEQRAKAAEVSIRASEKRFRDLFENSPDPIIVQDLSGNVLDANPAACRLHGLDHKTLKGMNQAQLKAPGVAAGSHDFDRMVRGEIEVLETASWNHQGYGVPVQIRCRRIEYDGQPALLLHLRDITELKAANELLEQRVADRTRDLTDAITKLHIETAERRAAQERAMQLQSQLAHTGRLTMLGELASGLAHEINQPLGAIVNYLRGCMEHIESGDANVNDLLGPITTAAAQAERAGQIVRHLRQFVTKGYTHQTRQSVPQMIHEVAELLEFESRDHKVSLRLDVPDDLPMVMADRVQVQQVLMNLMRNGIEAMDQIEPKQRLLHVAAAVNDENRVRISVRDAGCGCDGASLDRMFDAFYTTKEQGMGMGLAISRSIIEAHGGQLWAEHNHDRGLTFRFSLPIANGVHHG